MNNKSNKNNQSSHRTIFTVPKVKDDTWPRLLFGLGQWNKFVSISINLQQFSRQFEGLRGAPKNWVNDRFIRNTRRGLCNSSADFKKGIINGLDSIWHFSWISRWYLEEGSTAYFVTNNLLIISLRNSIELFKIYKTAGRIPNNLLLHSFMPRISLFIRRSFLSPLHWLASNLLWSFRNSLPTLRFYL